MEIDAATDGTAADPDPLSQLARLSRMTAPAGPPQGAPVPSGFRGLDRLLPAGGICRGSLVEWIGGPASGATALAFAVACRLFAACPAASGTIVVVDRRGRFHPPAVLSWLAASSHLPEAKPTKPTRSTKPTGSTKPAGGHGSLVVVRPARDEDEIWAIDQALRCPGVTAVVAWPERATSTALRRWQVGARAGGAVGLLVRPVQARREPSWAQSRLDVASLCAVEAALHPWPAAAALGGPVPLARLVPSLAVRRLRVTLVEGPWACEGPPDARAVEVALDLATGREASAIGREASAIGREASATGREASATGREASAERGTRGGACADGDHAARTEHRPVRPDGRMLPGGVQCRAS